MNNRSVLGVVLFAALVISGCDQQKRKPTGEATGTNPSSTSITSASDPNALTKELAARLALEFETVHCPVYHATSNDNTRLTLRDWLMNGLAHYAGVNALDPEGVGQAMHLGSPRQMRENAAAWATDAAGGKVYLLYSFSDSSVWDDVYACVQVPTRIEILDITPSSENPKLATVTVAETDGMSPFFPQGARVDLLGLPPGAGQINIGGIIHDLPIETWRGRKFEFQRLDATGWEVDGRLQ